MATYDVKLLSKREVAEGTMEFTLERPAGLEIRAGQFFDIVLPHDENTPKSASTHGFSFVNAAYENHLVAATRMRNSPFKNTIRETPDNTMVQVIAPFGDFTLHKNVAVPAVFITGGIGITPAFSMIKQATHDKTKHQLTLIYANDTPARAAYTDELAALAKENPNFHFVPVYAQADVQGAEKGRVNAEIVRKYVKDIPAAKFYLCGPEGMVKAMRSLLMEVGADEDNIRTEEFEGY
ncbi:Oxidoreductase FAD/NAD(P)-binding [gamma proteobacterium HdN1]|nr:Oxidoreductase FAD/NAD(P)-binding [gamma proteobacterium HdN1]